MELKAQGLLLETPELHILCIITARERSCGKVMFSQAVCIQGGASIWVASRGCIQGVDPDGQQAGGMNHTGMHTSRQMFPIQVN